MATILLVH